MTQAAFPRAGLLPRLGALLYDSLITLALWLVATFALIPILGQPAQDQVHALVPPGYTWLYQLYLGTLTWSFYSFFWRRGQTLGMQAWRLRITNSQGQTISLFEATLRMLGETLCLISIGLGYLWLLLDKKGRNWADYVSNTDIIQLPKPKR